MRLLNALPGAMLALSLMAAPAAFAADDAMKTKMDMHKNMNMDDFMKSCDMDHDGMVSRDEMMKHMGKMFDKMDAKKAGKLSKKQTEEMLKQLSPSFGG